MAEKWNHKITLSGENVSPSEEGVGKNFLREIHANNFGHYEGLEKTDVELKLIFDLQDVYSKFFIKFGLPDQQISIKKIHIVNRELFHSYRPKYTAGFTVGGEIILPRLGISDFEHNLAHEMAHAFSFLRDSYALHIEINEQGKSLNYTFDKTKRIGYGFENKQYHGLNEAVTEVFSSKVLSIMKSGKDIGDDVDGVPGTLQSYIPHFILLEQVVSRYQDLTGDKEIWNEIYKGYITGDMGWVKKLSIVHPEISRIFRDMGVSDEDVLMAAESCNLPGLIEKVKLYIEKNEA
jgi:hypothetical protein